MTKRARFPGRDIELDLGSAEAATSWKQLTGVAMAVEASLVLSSPTHPSTFRPKAILAVEPPMTHPDYLRAAPLRTGAGYIHGTLQEAGGDYEYRSRENLRIGASGVDHSLIVMTGNEPTILTPEGRQCNTLHPGDIVRAEVIPYGMDLAVYRTDSVIYNIGYENL
jgi:hypothetical protein